MSAYTHFVGIDWSGAKGKRHKGLAVAKCAVGCEAPVLVHPPSGARHWTRVEIGEWLSCGLGLDDGNRVLVGIDSSFSMPFVDYGLYLPNIENITNAKALWAAVDDACSAAVDYYGGPFVEGNADFYLRSQMRGVHFERRMRIPEIEAVATGAGPCESVFHLIGPSQVGLSGLSTMRMLNRLTSKSNIAVWPYEACENAPVVLTEIYAAMFAKLGGHRGKVRDIITLNDILQRLNSNPVTRHNNNFMFDDHVTDAVITAAGLRSIAGVRKYWHPAKLSTMVRRTEGWTFGVV